MSQRNWKTFQLLPPTCLQDKGILIGKRQPCPFSIWTNCNRRHFAAVKDTFLGPRGPPRVPSIPRPSFRAKNSDRLHSFKLRQSPHMKYYQMSSYIWWWQTQTHTQCLKDPTYSIFSGIRGSRICIIMKIYLIFVEQAQCEASHNMRACYSHKSALCVMCIPTAPPLPNL